MTGFRRAGQGPPPNSPNFRLSPSYGRLGDDSHRLEQKKNIYYSNVAVGRQETPHWFRSANAWKSFCLHGVASPAGDSFAGRCGYRKTGLN